MSADLFIFLVFMAAWCAILAIAAAIADHLPRHW
jgi:hypothetical protein